MRRVVMLSAGLFASACASHTYATPVVTTVDVGQGQQVDIAWVVEDGGRVIRCTNTREGPRCRRARVD